MAAVLGKVVHAPTPGQGRDVVHQFCAPQSWLRRGNVLLVTLPRLLRCAACEGGGCDHCERRGALELRGREAVGEVVRVELSQDVDSRHVIRIPERGARAPGSEARGCLLLRVAVGPAAPGVELETASSAAHGTRPVWLWGVIAVLLAVASGWWAASGGW